MTLWEIDIHPLDGQPDRGAQRVLAEARDVGIVGKITVGSARGFLIDGTDQHLTSADAQRVAGQLLVDRVVESAVVAPVGDPALLTAPFSAPHLTLVHVLPKPGVMDPVAASAQAAIRDLGIPTRAVRTLMKYWIALERSEDLDRLCTKILSNDSIEQVVVGPLRMRQLETGTDYQLHVVTIPLRSLNAEALVTLSRTGQLYLSLTEMQTIQAHFQQLQRDPTDAELETIAQTWSEHCSHKTLAGRVDYQDERGARRFENLLKETIFAATVEVRRRLGPDDWCVSVFRDNAGIVRFDETHNVVFKVETHNHPSAIEPYGGANTGIGGVIRDPLGTGLGAKPICNTDVFCFAPPQTSSDDLPPGVLHPRRVMQGVVSGVRDYGNRMGIPTVNGAILFDDRYLGNPLVYCGTVGILPRDKSDKQVLAGDYIVAVGGRTGRDGIHGATFSSAELTSESESVSGGAVQIGNAITEKMVLDVVLQARDLGLYHAITDCGAGGFSSAVGEMGEELGAEVWLDRAPLKYDGLSYTEIWISEAQERMVLAVPPNHWEAFKSLCAAEGVEATVLGVFQPTGRLVLKYHDVVVADLSMEFLHQGRPPVIRQATYRPTPPREGSWSRQPSADFNYRDSILRILGSLNVCSKEWVIRQYDHEVQGGSVIKPLVGRDNDGPSDAAVVRPTLTSYRGLVVSCGINPHYGDWDTYHMATSAIDEAMRNAVAVGADPRRIAILDNFCWGNTDRPETLGSLVRAAIACHDLAVELGTPFISGKDSLNNEFRYTDHRGEGVNIAIPATLLISALGQVDDVRNCVTMDFKRPGNLLYLVGLTREELGGSQFSLLLGDRAGHVPQVDADLARRTFAAMHQAISAGHVAACHDLSEGGLAVAVAEMAFAGGFGARVQLERVPHALTGPKFAAPPILLFSESNTRFLLEVPPERAADLERVLQEIPHARIGDITADPRLVVQWTDGDDPNPNPNQHQKAAPSRTLMDVDVSELKEAWQSPLRW